MFFQLQGLFTLGRPHLECDEANISMINVYASARLRKLQNAIYNALCPTY